MSNFAKNRFYMEEKEKNAIFDITKNKLFFGNIDKLHDWNEGEISQAKIIEKVKMTLKNYMEFTTPRTMRNFINLQ